MFSYTSIKDYHSFLGVNPDGCVQAVKHYVAAIESNKHLNAFLEVFADEALQRAAELDKQRKDGLPIGKLHGVVVSLKDVICYKGHIVTAASKILNNFESVFSATAVDRLLAEGAIIIGRNNCDEFAMGSSSENSAFGTVKNAIDTSRVPGGSSGGSAVAVQANLTMISLGSDTGGSVRQPADFCGIIGVKPTYGRISRYGLIAYASSFDQIGIFGKNLADVALALEVMSGEDNFDSTASSKPVASYEEHSHKIISGKKIAYFKQVLDHPGIDPEIKVATENYIQALSDKGFVVEAINFDWLDYIVPTYYILTTAEATSNLSRFDGVRYGYRSTEGIDDLNEMYKQSRTKGFGKEVQRRILLGNFVLSSGYFDAYFTKAQQVRKLLCDNTSKIFEQYDAIISPTVPSPAFKLGEKSDDSVAMYLADIYTVYANLVGLPSISVPLFTHSNGMPFGLQLMTNHFEEELMFALSNSFLAK